MLGQVWHGGRAAAVVRSPEGVAALDLVHGAGSTVLYLHVSPDEVDSVAGALRLPPTAVEDARRQPSRPDELPQRTKYERYPDVVFLYLYYAAVPDGDGSPGAGQVDDIVLLGVPVFVSRSFLVVVDHGAFADPDTISRRWHPGAVDVAAGNLPAAEVGTAALLHTVLDLVVDSYLAAADALAGRIDVLEDALFESSSDFDPSELQRASYGTRKALARLRRVAIPMREVVSAAMRTEEDDQILVGPALWPLYQDVYDHAVRVTEELEGLRDLLTTLYEARIAMADHIMNSVMKKLAAWAAIIAVPTAVTGFYGQNVRYPGFNTVWGFAFSTAVWVGISLGLYVLFRTRRWL